MKDTDLNAIVVTLGDDDVVDPTNTRLDAAILDQVVAGKFHDKDHAYVCVHQDREWTVGIAVANERGYTPVGGSPTFASHDEGTRFCRGMNKHIGLTEDAVDAIIISTMGGVHFERGLYARH
jgi:hypothetical protein